MDRDACESALANARRVHAEYSSVCKTMWGSPAGKKRIAKRIAGMLPPHTTYVEPFVGSGAILFAKPLSKVEVINDADPEIAEAYRAVQRLTPQGIAKLKKLSWTGSDITYKQLRDSQPKDDVGRLHKFLYLSHFSYGKLRGKSFNPGANGVQAKTVSRVEEFAPRIRRAKIYSGDYEAVVRKYDSKDTLHFLDPPYVGYNVAVGESKFTEERFFNVCKAIKGKFLVTYGIRGELPKLVKGTNWWQKRIRTRRSIAMMRGVGGSSVLTQLVFANYEPKITKAFDAEFELVDWDGSEEEPGAEEIEKVQPTEEGAVRPLAFEKTTRLFKGLDPADERYVMGVVLEPEVVDAQQDIYSAETIRDAAHRFMEYYRGLGDMHQRRVNDQVKILESYLAPVDFQIGGSEVRKGTWLLAVRVISDELWERVSSGDLTGFSIGGSARKIPEPQTSRAAPEESEEQQQAAE